MPKNVITIGIHRDNLSALVGWILAHLPSDYESDPEFLRQFLTVASRELKALREADNADGT